MKEAWPFFFLAAVQHSCGFLEEGGCKGTRRKKTQTLRQRKRGREREEQRIRKNSVEIKSTASVSPVLTGHPEQEAGPRGSPGPLEGGVLSQLSSLQS